MGGEGEGEGGETGGAKAGGAGGVGGEEVAVTEVVAAGEMVILAATTLNHRRRPRRHCHHTRSLWEGEATGGVVGMGGTAAAAQGKVDRGATATVGVG